MVELCLSGFPIKVRSLAACYAGRAVNTCRHTHSTYLGARVWPGLDRVRAPGNSASTV
jgi:hypothetical protein